MNLQVWNFSRWFDLVRNEMVKEIVDAKNADELPPNAAITDKVYYVPKPFVDTSGNPALLE